MIERISQPIQIIEKGLDAVWTQNDVLAANIANADTPGYKAKTVDFVSVFSQALQPDWMDSDAGLTSVSSASLRSLDPSDLQVKISENSNASLKLDGNSVDVDREMTSLAENALLYDALTYAVSKELGRIKLIINEGK